MEEWIQHILSSDQAGFSVLIAVFLFGILSVFSCACNFSVIGIVAGYSGTLGSTGKTKAVLLNTLFLLIGMVVSMAAIGGIIGYASELISLSFGNYWKLAAGLISIFFGLFAMDFLPFKMRVPNLKMERKKTGTLASILFGLAIGGLTLACSGCCNPVFPIILAVSFVKGSSLWGMLMMVAYALGYGLTFAAIVMAVGLGLGTTSRRFAKAGKVLKYVGGSIMILVGFYLLITL